MIPHERYERWSSKQLDLRSNDRQRVLYRVSTGFDRGSIGFDRGSIGFDRGSMGFDRGFNDINF